MSHLNDPGPHIKQMIDTFASRQLLVDELLKTPSITIGQQALIRIVELLLPQSKVSITSILGQDSALWETLSLQNKNKAINQEEEKNNVDFHKVYESLVEKSDIKIDLNQIIDISHIMSAEIVIYKHCDY